MQSIQLTRILKQLLESHSVVNLLGLGRFRVQLSPALLRPYAGTIREPRREVCFEKGEFVDDQLVITALGEQLGLSPEDARLQVEECAREWEIALSRNQYLELPELGTLYYGAKGVLYFKLKEGIVLPPGDILSIQDAQCPQEIELKESQEKSIIQRGKWWMLVTAGILIFGGIYLYFNLRKAEEKPIWGDLQQKVIPKEDAQFQQSIAVDSLQDTVQLPTTVKPSPQAKPTAPAKPTVQAKPAVQAKAPAARYNVHIIAGSAVPKKTAIEQQKQYKRKGINTSLVTLKNGKCLLSLGLYRSREEAENALPAHKRKLSAARILEL